MTRPDDRNHLSVVSEEDLEWLGNLHGDDVGTLFRLMGEAEEFGDVHLMQACRRYIRLGTSVGAGRANLMASVAIHDEILRRAKEENRVPDYSRVQGEPRLPEEPGKKRDRRERKL